LCVWRFIECLFLKTYGKGLDVRGGTGSNGCHDARVNTSAEEDSHGDVGDEAGADTLFNMFPEICDRFFEGIGDRLFLERPVRVLVDRTGVGMDFEVVAREELPDPLDDRLMPRHVVESEV
jgi:hypothetical protein